MRSSKHIEELSNNLDIQAFNKDTVEFLNQFSQVLYSVGGNNLVQQINAELVLAQRAGGNLLEVLFDIYEDFRRAYQQGV